MSRMIRKMFNFFVRFWFLDSIIVGRLVGEVVDREGRILQNIYIGRVLHSFICS
jgi:hypothetical protein